MATLLLTGGSGFVGRNAMPLLSSAYRVTTLGRSPANDIATDLACSVPDLPAAPDVVVHAAALAHPHRDTRPDMFAAVNVEGTRHLCAALERAGVPRAFVFISTVAVYGCPDNACDVDENAPLGGTSAYARSKIEAERYLRQWCARHQVALAILRPSVLIGPGAPGNMRSMIHGIKHGYYIGIGSGSGLRSITHVEDLAQAIVAAIGRNGVWNIAGESMSTADLERMIAKALGRRRLLRIPTRIAGLIARIGDHLPLLPLNTYRLHILTRSLTFSSDRAHADLGWHPTPLSARPSTEIF